MSCENNSCPEACKTPIIVTDCADEHLSSFCAPPCCQCCPDPCSQAYDCCEINIQNLPKPITRRYQILKHVIRRAPSNCESTLPRTNFKPIPKYKLFNPCDTLNYETNYTRSYNAICCRPTVMEDFEIIQ